MEITYDPAKRQACLEERGLDFRDAAQVFAGAVLTFEDARQDYAERRFVSVGRLAGRMVVLVWTPAGAGRRVISMRKANEREQARYAKALAGGE